MIASLANALQGRYAIDREIGRGGMATVFLARDVRHNRHVALKVLNPELGAVLGVERFLAEIEVTANLQHPNLLPLFDSGEANGLLFYVMPFIQGESLRARLDREKQLPVDEAVRIAMAIAGALDYAHRHKVIHRDLKPENILMQEGQPLIADFGIALAVSKAGGERITQTGLSLGTPQYMSPEQATGDRVVDGRTDIYSLGAMVYEMLVGDPPHHASTSQAIIAKVLTERPTSVRTARPSVPPHVDAAIGKALEKLAADRFATAKEFADALEGKGSVVTSAYQPAPVARTSRTREVVAWSLVVALAALAGWLALKPAPTVAETQVIRANFDLPPNVRVNDVLAGTTIAVSPKGDMIAFTSISVSGFQMFLRRVNEVSARRIGDGNVAGRNLAFSPDGRWLAFSEGNLLKKIDVEGGQVVTLGTTGGSVPYGISWSATDTIYIGGFSGMWKVPGNGGEAVAVSASDSSTNRLGRRWPYVLPDGKAVVFASGNSSSAIPRMSVLELGTETATELSPIMAAPLGLIDDQFVYVTNAGALMAVRFDRRTHRVIGDPLQLDEGVLVDPTSGVKASLSATGTLAYLRGRAQFQPVVIRGNSAPSPLIPEPGSYSTPRFSPDGRKVALSVTTTNSQDVWIYDIDRNTFQRLTTEGANVRPEWTPDGRQVVFISQRGGKAGIWRQPVDGSGPAEKLFERDLEPFEAIVSPDAKWLVIRTAPGSRFSRDILAMPLTGGDTTLTPLVTGPYTESLPRISPDGKWLAYQSNETTSFQIYVRPFPGAGARTAVSDLGGTEPLWGKDGKSLYYRGPLGEVVRVDVTTGSNFSIGKREVMLNGDYLTDSSHPNWDVAPDGRFLMLKRAGAEAQTIIVHNWGRELREKTAPRQ